MQSTWVAQPLSTTCTEEASILSWQSFLTSYSRGSFPNSSYPPIPLSSPQTSVSADPLARPVISDPESLYPTQAISSSIARNVRNFSIDQGYLPPPRSADEVLREQCIQEYELEGAHQRANIQSAVDVLAAIFPETVCTFTIFRGARQTFIAVAGDQGIRDELGLYTDFEVRSDLGFCGHCVLLKENVMFVPNLQDDWRFANNPYSQAGLKSYIGVPITLELDRLSSDSDDGVPQRVSIGALNILYRKDYLPELTETSKMVVTNISRMLETQLRATWDGNRRTVEAKYRHAVAEMIQDAFVGELETVEDGARAGLQDLGALAQHAAENLVNLLPQLDSVTVIDTKNLIASISSSTALDDSSITSSHVLGQASKSSPSLSLPSPGSIAALYQIPNHQRRTVFSPLHKSGLEPFLPSQCSTHVAMPFSTRAHPSFLILCTSQSLTLSSTTINIIRNIGALLLARATQDLVIEADAAKTVFLSSISHELRTPLHSIMAAIDLTYDYLSVDESRSASLGGREQLLELLNAIRSSSAALQGTLNDVLEFGKPPTRQISPHDTLSASTSVHLDTLSDRRGSVSAQSSQSNGSTGQGPHVTVNVVKCIKDAIQICLLQDGSARDREIAFEHEDRDWSLRMDEAKLLRIITNGLSNALKFCLSAPIVISLTCTKDDPSRFDLVVTDHGPGIDAALVPRLMEAFTKQDVNTPGIGLGLHITNRLVNDMGGKLRIVPVPEPGTGTRFVVELPRVCVETHDQDGNGEGLDGTGLIREMIKLPTFAKPSRPASPPDSDRIAVLNDSETMARRPSLIPRDSELKDTAKTDDSPSALLKGFVDLKVSVPPPIASTTLKQTESPAKAAPTDFSHEALRVMVIDDNTICRRLLSAFVTKTLRAIHTPHSKPVVKQYPDAVSAIADFLIVKPHLILTDVSMPSMDGVTAAAEMRALGANIRPVQEEDGGDDRAGLDSALGSEIWGRDHCYIYAITGLGSSDPRLKASGMLGSAALDGWLVKGKDDMKRIEEILKESEARLRV